MKKRKPVKAMFSLKKRFGDGGGSSDPIIREWRALTKLNEVGLVARLMLLAFKLPPYNGVAYSDSDNEDDPPEGIAERMAELQQHLLDAGEIDSREIAAANVEPFVDELRAGILEENVIPLPNEATLMPMADELCGRAWTIVNRERPGSLAGRIEGAVLLLSQGFTQTALDPIAPDVMDGFVDMMDQAFCTWLFTHRSELLTVAEAEEMRAFQRPRP